MKSLKVGLEGLAAVDAGFTRKQRAVQKGVGDAVKDGAQRVRAYAYELIRIPFRKRALWRNVQDGVTKRTRISATAQLAQARMDYGKGEAQVMVRAHFTSARTPTVKAVLDKTGNRALRMRTHLWVQRGFNQHFERGSGSHRAHESRAGLQKVSFTNQGLRFWEDKDNKDTELRDTVKLEGEPLRQIIMVPAVARQEKQILSAIRRATQHALSR
jgi:hypothetical protein